MTVGKPAMFAAGLVLVATLGVSCRKNPQVSFEVDVPSGLANQATWVEVGAYPGATCATLGPQAEGGLPQGYAARIAWKLGDGSPTPSMGDLPKKSYAFIGALRDQQCGVIGLGCITADMSNTSSVTLGIKPTGKNPAPGTCADDAVCQDATCVSSPDGTNPNVGSGCSLQLIGAGPFGGRILDGDNLADENIGSPAVAATSSGFLIAYREMATGLGQARVRLIAVDPGGGSAGAVGADLPRCTGDDEKDGVGLAFSGDAGLVGLSRHLCAGSNAGVDYIAVGPGGAIGGYAEVYNAAAPSDTVEFSYGTGIAASATAGTFDVTYLQDGNAIFAQTQAGTLAEKPTEAATRVPLFPSGGPYLEAHVASSPKLVAFLTRNAGALGTGGTADAGADAGDAGSRSGNDVDAGTSAPAGTLHLQIVPSSITPATFGTQPSVDFPGPWGAVAAFDTNVAVLTQGTEQPLGLQIYDQSRALVAQSDIATASADPYIAGDVAFVGGRVLIAAARTGSISLFAFTSGADAGGLLPELLLEQDPRVPDLRAFRDGHVAIAASSTRVLVAWTTATQLTGSDPTGGYALFACAP